MTNLTDLESRLAALLAEVEALNNAAHETLKTTTPGEERRYFYNNNVYHLDNAQDALKTACDSIRAMPR